MFQFVFEAISIIFWNTPIISCNVPITLWNVCNYFLERCNNFLKRCNDFLKRTDHFLKHFDHFLKYCNWEAWDRTPSPTGRCSACERWSTDFPGAASPQPKNTDPQIHTDFHREISKTKSLEKICVHLCPSGITAWIGFITAWIGFITAWIGFITAWIGGITTVIRDISAWIGALLTDWTTVREWTKTMRWSGIAPNVSFWDKSYERGAKLSQRELKPDSQRWIRTPGIEKWAMVIPQQKLARYFPAKA